MKLENCRVTVGGITTAWDFGRLDGDVSTVSFFGGNAAGGKTIAMHRQIERLYELKICQSFGIPARLLTGAARPDEAATSPLARANAMKSANRKSLDAKTERKPYD